MIAKAELLRKFNEIIVTEGYAMPLYLGHMLQTLPWYGLPADLENTTRKVLDKIRRETETTRSSAEQLYLAIQENGNEEF